MNYFQYETSVKASMFTCPLIMQFMFVSFCQKKNWHLVFLLKVVMHDCEKQLLNCVSGTGAIQVKSLDHMSGDVLISAVWLHFPLGNSDFTRSCSGIKMMAPILLIEH